MIYLACPYTSPDDQEVADRVTKASMAAAYLMDTGERVYSPITHGHSIVQHMENKQITQCHKFWLDQCYPQIIASNRVVVLMLEGWTRSKGVRWEVETAWAWGIPVYIMRPESYKQELLQIKEWHVSQIFGRG